MLAPNGNAFLPSRMDSNQPKLPMRSIEWLHSSPVTVSSGTAGGCECQRIRNRQSLVSAAYAPPSGSGPLQVPPTQSPLLIAVSLPAFPDLTRKTRPERPVSLNVLEHPELLANRIVDLSSVVGREDVIAGPDCGLGGRVHPQLAWVKLKTLTEGPRSPRSALELIATE